MPYKVISDGAVTILEKVGDRTYRDRNDGYKEVELPIHESNVWMPNDVIPDSKVAPVVKDAYDDGEEHIRSILKRVTKKPAKKNAEE